MFQAPLCLNAAVAEICWFPSVGALSYFSANRMIFHLLFHCGPAALSSWQHVTLINMNLHFVGNYQPIERYGTSLPPFRGVSKHALGDFRQWPVGVIAAKNLPKEWNGSRNIDTNFDLIMGYKKFTHALLVAPTHTIPGHPKLWLWETLIAAIGSMDGRVPKLTQTGFDNQNEHPTNY